MLIKDLNVTINREEVFHKIDCHKSSELYAEIVEEYKEIEDKMYDLCEPVCLVKKSVFKNREVLMVLYSVGEGISAYATKCFERGDYLKGMLADAMADSALFSLEKEIRIHLKKVCNEIGKGICQRWEAPRDIPIETQKIIFQKVNAEGLCGMKLSSGYMIEPVKSNAIIYLLSDNPNEFQVTHDCKKCNNYTCKYR